MIAALVLAALFAPLPHNPTSPNPAATLLAPALNIGSGPTPPGLTSSRELSQRPRPTYPSRSPASSSPV